MESMIDSRSSLRAIKQRFQNIPPNLKTKIDERDNDGIISFIQTESSNINENYKVNIHLLQGLIKIIAFLVYSSTADYSK